MNLRRLYILYIILAILILGVALGIEWYLRQRATQAVSTTNVGSSTPEQAVTFAHETTKQYPNSANSLAFAALSEAQNAPEFPTSTHRSLLSEAQTTIDQAVALAPQDANIYRTRGDIEMIAGNMKAAAADYTKTLVINPKTIPARIGLIRAYKALGLDMEAKKIFTETQQRIATSSRGLPRTP